MPGKFCLDGVNIPYYLIGEPGSGTEHLLPEDLTPRVYQDYDAIKASLAEGQLFEDPHFGAILRSLAYDPKEKDNELPDLEQVVWLRPSEILKKKRIEGDPIFVDNGGDPDKVGIPDDVNQNALGDCWFLCSMAEMSRLPDIFWMVVCKENLTQFNKDEYRGIFKFRFAAFGRLVEVVVDDRIPFNTTTRQHWSVVADNPRVFWSALMEKAYAKLYSSYQAIQGGWIGDALQDFTGGVIDRHSKLEKMEKDEVWKIIRDSHRAGFYMGASVMKDFKTPREGEKWAEKVGLGNYHAYSILTVKEVDIGKKHFRLIRIRNPWGEATEFKGAFNEKTGKLFKKLDEATQKEFPAGEDGEFWMTLREFVKNFYLLEVVNLNPFGSKGKTLDELCEAINFARQLKDSEWTEENCFGKLGAKDDDDSKNGDEEEAGEEEECDDEDDEEDCEDEDDTEEEAEEEEAEEEEEEVYELEHYDRFSKNPQIQFTVPEIDLNEHGKSEVVVSLLQRYRRNLKEIGGDEIDIGMSLAKIVTDYPVKGSEIFNKTSEFVELAGGTYRSHTKRVHLTPGKWVVIPYNEADAYADFTVIVFTKK